MGKLILKLYPSEFRDLIGYLRSATLGQQCVPLGLQQVGTLVMIEYVERLSLVRIRSWLSRRAHQRYALKVPLVVGLALYQHMQQATLTDHQQLLLDQLDQAIVNYRNPDGACHSVGELLHFTVNQNQPYGQESPIR